MNSSTIAAGLADASCGLRRHGGAWTTVLLLVAGGCQSEELQPTRDRVIRLEAIPKEKQLEMVAGESTKLGLQTIGPNGAGTNGAPVLFFMSGALIKFDAIEDRSIRMVTDSNAIGDVTAPGLAIATIVASADLETEVEARVFGALLDDFADETDTVADAPPSDPDLLAVVEFVIVLRPAPPAVRVAPTTQIGETR